MRKGTQKKQEEEKDEEKDSGVNPDLDAGNRK